MTQRIGRKGTNPTYVLTDLALVVPKIGVLGCRQALHPNSRQSRKSLDLIGGNRQQGYMEGTINDQGWCTRGEGQGRPGCG